MCDVVRLFLLCAWIALARAAPALEGVEGAQVPRWSEQDLAFFLHGSMGTEVIPQRVLQAFESTYPDLFPGKDLAAFGLIKDDAAGLPIGFSRREVEHLGGLPSLGVNCASCHVTEIAPAGGGATVRVLGVTSHFDAEAFFGAIAVATFRTADPANMERFLASYLSASDIGTAEKAAGLLRTELKRQHEKIVSALSGDPSGAEGLKPGALNEIPSEALGLDLQRLQAGIELAPLAHSFLRLFHNMRAALHIPDKLPDTPPPPPSGPGRNDAFGLLSLSLFGVATKPAPVKYGLIWNTSDRTWVHWDGNTRSPIGRNVLAALGLGGPLLGKQGKVDFALIKRHTELSEQIRAPRYPWQVDATAAKAGAAHYQAQCASCHDAAREQEERRLYSVEEVKTDPNRARQFTPQQAQRFNTFLSEVQITGFDPGKDPAIRSTGKYWAADLAGVWARAPYLHNGSVPTMMDLLTSQASRPKTFKRGSRVYDTARMGYVNEGHYVFETTADGNSNSGHEYATDLSNQQKHELIEYLKTR